MVISPEIRAKFELQSSYTRKEGWNIFYDASVPYNVSLTAEIFQLNEKETTKIEFKETRAIV